MIFTRWSKKIKKSNLSIFILNHKSNIGLILNIIGTLMIAFSFGKAEYGFGGGYRCESSKTGWCEFVYFLYPQLFNAGIWFIVIGFLFQIKRKSK